MGFLGRDQGDVLDLTMLAKRGILKKKSLTERTPVDVVDLTSMVPTVATHTPSSVSSEPSPLSLFDAITSQTNVFASPQPTTELTREKKDLELQTLQVKLDDLEYKLGRFMDRMESVERRLLEFENKTR